MDSDDYYSIILAVLAVGIGVWLNAVLTALGDLSGGKIRKLDKDRYKALIARAERWLENRDVYSITVRLLILLNMGVLASVCFRLALHMATPAEGPQLGLLLLASVVATLLYVLPSESLGNGRFGGANLGLMSVSMPLIQLASCICYPVVRPITYVQHRADSWRTKVEEEEKPTTEDEIMSLVENDAYEAEERTLEDHERRMIRGIFDLDETIVREIMTPRVDIVGLAADVPVDEARERFVASGHSRIPLYKETIDNIVGMLYAKDLLNHRDDGQAPVESLRHEPYFVPETKDVKQLLEEFKSSRNQIAVVIDEYGGTAGLVTIEDILEEIVGEILDEYDADEPEGAYQLAADGSVDLDARTPIDEINDLLQVDISEEEDYDTIGGCVNSELGRIPKVGETFQIDGLSIDVLEADERKISRLRLRKLPEVAETDEAS